MNLNFPHREAVVVRGHELRVVRRFATEGDIKARAGERVGPDQVLGKSDPSAAAVRVDLADRLDISPREASKHLLKPVGSTFGVGEAMARARRGLRTAVVAAPVAGTLIDVDTETGVASLVPTGAGELTAMVPGDIEFVDGRQSVMIRTVGARVLGIFGIGGQARGPLRIAVGGPGEELSVKAITGDMKGAVVVGGAVAGAAALAKLVEVGAAAIVTGGMLDREVATFMDWQGNDRLAPWRPQVGSGVLADGSPSRLVMMVTEGFGRLPIAAPAWEAMGEANGRSAVVFATTRLSAPLSRPELILPNEGALDDDATTSQAALVPGAAVRLVDQANLGRFGTVAADPRRDRAGDGQVVDVVEIALGEGGSVTVPASAVEVLV